MLFFSKYQATPQEVGLGRGYDHVLPEANLIVDSAFTIPGITREELWPWIAQIGKNRAGWYLPYRFERFTSKKWHGLRTIDPALQTLSIGQEIDDWTRVKLQVIAFIPRQTLAFRGKLWRWEFTWELALVDVEGGTRIHSRTRVGGVKHPGIFAGLGRFADRLVAAGLAGGLRDRL